jgi:hypothetical protein
MRCSSLPVAQRVNQQRERRRGLAPARVVEVIASKGRAPVLQHADQPTICEVCLCLVLKHASQSETGRGGPEDHRVGLNGSAYVVGGFGFTAAMYDEMVVVPIRTGVGARLGVNVGYLKFTPEPTWNPF